jgi:hypothetical protein
MIAGDLEGTWSQDDLGEDCKEREHAALRAALNSVLRPFAEDVEKG